MPLFGAVEYMSRYGDDIVGHNIIIYNKKKQIIVKGKISRRIVNHRISECYIFIEDEPFLLHIDYNIRDDDILDVY